MKNILPTIGAGILFSTIAISGCRFSDEKEAARLCAEADKLDETDHIAALALRRKIWEELPTTGTRGATKCARKVRERMGKVRSLVSHDVRGDDETVKECAWAADAFEVFSGSSKLPFREHWARRLMERCIHVVGRSWTRKADSKYLADLNEKLKKLAEEKK